MVQINIRIDKTLDAVITFLAEQRGVSKSLVARELLDEGKNQMLLPTLAKMYRDGKIPLKKIVTLTGLHHVEVIERLSSILDDAPLTPENDKYTGKIVELILKSIE
ncbi:MAG: hypothetical protein ACFFCS_05260 [Candidatus Hodarchaeota archaeon]